MIIQSERPDETLKDLRVRFFEPATCKWAVATRSFLIETATVMQQ